MKAEINLNDLTNDMLSLLNWKHRQAYAKIRATTASEDMVLHSQLLLCDLKDLICVRRYSSMKHVNFRHRGIANHRLVDEMEYYTP
jgi:hypothetical protein